jgi:hypothetical protein
MLSEVHKPQKVFTVQGATRTLPLVGMVLRDIVEANAEIESLHSRRRQVGSRREAEGASGASPRAMPRETRGREDLEARIEEKVREIDDCLRELESIGCQCKDFRMGLVDFPAMLDGRVVYLCWKLGESEIGHWHEVDSGFSGRQPVGRLFG